MTSSTEFEAALASAVEAARFAANASPAERAHWLNAAADALDAQADELVALAEEETHLPTARLSGELRRTTFQIRFLAAESATGEPFQATIDRADGNWPIRPRPDLRRVGIPVGVVGVFGASNFPFAFSVAGGDTASALAAGCSVVHKVHSGHLRLGLGVAEIVGSAIAASGGPHGLLMPVTGREAGEKLVDDSRVRAIGFTGSTEGGRALFDRAMRRPEPIPFFGELGSLNPVLVMEGAWRERRGDILDGYVASLTLGMGQFCTKPGLLVLPESEPTELARELADRIEGISRHRLLTDQISRGFEASVARVGESPSVDRLVSTALSPADPGEAPSVTVYYTTADAVLADPQMARTEMFGPAGLVILGARRESMPELIAAFGGQLTGSLHADESDDVHDILDALASQSGRIIWNGWPTGVTVSYSQHHGGPYPASTNAASTSVGTAAIGRFLRPTAYQDVPDSLLPPALQDANPWGIRRRVDGEWSAA